MTVENPCCSDLDLAAYLEGRLPADERRMIERYVANNAECRTTLETVRTVIAGRDDLHSAEDVPEQVMQRAVAHYPRNNDLLDLIITVIGDALTVVRTSLDVRIADPLPAASLRTGNASSASIVVMTKSFAALKAEVHIEKLQGNTCAIAIRVSDRLTHTAASNLRIDLISQGREFASCSLDNGRVLFEDVNHGCYDIIIQKRGVPCGAMKIKIA